MATMTATVHPYYQRRYRRIVWRQRYDGLVTVAYRSGHAIAGISGPWSDRYVLTWWAQQYSAGSLELFDSLEAAQTAVAQRVRENQSGNRVDLQGVLQSIRESLRPSWMARIGSLFFRTKTERLAHSTLQMRDQYLRQDADLSGIHFDAYC
jgi:hypothetical protein